MMPNRNRFISPATGGLVEDPRCSDADFAAANPSLCPNSLRLVVKPETATLCAGGRLQCVAFLSDTTERLVEDNYVFTSSSPGIATVTETGLVTAVAPGIVTICATWYPNEGDPCLGFAQLTVLAGASCCDNISVVSAVVMDNSRSMLQDFGGGVSTKLTAAKAMAASVIEHLREDLDGQLVIAFNEPASLLLDESADADALGETVMAVPSTQRRTDMRNAFDFAVKTLASRTKDRKVILILSDGENRPMLSLEQSAKLLDAARAFKESGGIIICIGLRAKADGYVLLRNMATGGYFVNITDGSQIDDAQHYLSMMMKQTCASEADYGVYFSAQVPDPAPLAETEAYPAPWRDDRWPGWGN